MSKPCQIYTTREIRPGTKTYPAGEPFGSIELPEGVELMQFINALANGMADSNKPVPKPEPKPAAEPTTDAT